MRASLAFLVAGLAVTAAGSATAQSGRTIPVEQDLRRFDAIEQRLDEREQRTGERLLDAPASPGLPVQSDPTGVAGYTGPPGGYGDSVGGFNALPQGAAGADVR